MMDGSSMNLADVLLGVMSGLIGILIWVVKSFATSILSEIKRLDARHYECVSRFADSESTKANHRQMYGRLEDHEHRITVLETEAKDKGRG